MALDSPTCVRDAYAGRLWPDEQVRVFSHTEHMFPTRRIPGGTTSRPLPPAPEPLAELSFSSRGSVFDLYDHLSRNRIAGLLVLQHDRVVLERYELGITESTRWMSMSMAKSISSTLVGAAIQDGCIGGLDDLLIEYLPELERGAYADVSIRQLLRMTSGARWNEDHTDPGSERRRMLELQIEQRPGAVLDFMSRLPKEAPAGRRWNYSTGETHLVGALLRAGTGRWVADYLSEKIWSRLGMEHDATWWLESPEGLEIAGSGICATLRDYARFGAFVLADGVIGGERVLPPGWVAEAGAGYSIDGQDVPYGYMWWPTPGRDGAIGGHGFSARGIFGQRIHVNPVKGLVVVMLSARSKPMQGEVIDDNDFFNALAERL
jgi:CubicO group peptidase (beta-lactamase class C family)